MDILLENKDKAYFLTMNDEVASYNQIIGKIKMERVRVEDKSKVERPSKITVERRDFSRMENKERMKRMNELFQSIEKLPEDEE
jgi:type II secretory pathway component PulC